MSLLVELYYYNSTNFSFPFAASQKTSYLIAIVFLLWIWNTMRKWMPSHFSTIKVCKLLKFWYNDRILEDDLILLTNVSVGGRSIWHPLTYPSITWYNYGGRGHKTVDKKWYPKFYKYLFLFHVLAVFKIFIFNDFNQKKGYFCLS